MKFRIPLSGGYNTRIELASTSASTGYVGIGVVGVMIVGKTSPSSQKDRRFINCFYHTIENRRFTVKRPGFAEHTTPSAGNKATGLLIWTGEASGVKVISAFGVTNSVVYDGVTSLGAITGKCTGISETIITTTPTILVSSSDNTAWYYTGTGSMTKITDADFPGNASKTLAGTFVHMDGYACIMDTTGAVWASDLNSLTGWTATSFDSANAYPDKGIGLARHKNFIMAFGTESVQFFYNAGLTPFPFTKSTAMTLKIGAISAEAITQISDTVFWCGSTPQGGLSIYQFDGGISRISTPEIDNVLLLAGASNISMTTYRMFGLSFVICITGQSTLVYCIEEKAWHEWSSRFPLWYKCVGVSIGATMVNYAVSNVSPSGKVYTSNPASYVFSDDGVSYTAKIQTENSDHGTNRRKFFSEIELVCDIEPTSSPITLSYSDDDYQSFTTYGDLNLNDERPRATRLGASKKRAWRLEHSANTPFRIEEIRGELEVGQ